jgi:DNA-binding CsgD family transcriptional regulator
MAIGEPSVLAFLLDEVEAHSLLGDAASAAAVLMAFDRHCEADPPPWVAPLALRARGLVEAATRDLETARATLAEAVADEAHLPLPLERARTRLAHGRVLRRLQHRARARTELAHALAQFEELGAALWAERAREELGRVGGRAASTEDLTPTEQRIAELVAEGRSNREVGAALFVTPKTVESALTRVYRKLGVRSRTELARRLVRSEA